MGLIGYRQALVVVLALALITALYFMSQVAAPAQHRQIVDHLLEIRRLEAVANQDALKARSGLLAEYDSFVTNTARVLALLGRIRENSVRIYGKDPNELTRAVDDLKTQFAKRSAMIEDFKSDNAILRNSVGYFPIAAAEISASVRRTADASLANAIDNLRLDLLEFYISGNDSLRDKVALRIQDLAGAADRVSQSIPVLSAFRRPTGDLRHLLAHAKIILDFRSRVNADVEEILTRSLAKGIEKMLKMTEGHYAASLAETEKYRFLLYAAAIAFLGYITVMIARLQRGALALHDAKEEADRANRTKTQFLANMSHELRTPLNAIVGFAKILADEMFGPVGNKRYKDYANDIYASGNLLVALIGDILDIAKVESGKIEIYDETVNVRDLVFECARMMDTHAKRANVRLSVSAPDDLPRLRADGIRIKQVVINLLDNSIKFTPPNGHVTVETRLETSGGISLKVADDGIGIAKEDIGKAFEVFGRPNHRHARTRKGSGLGLALSKSLLELHGGTLTVDSDVDKGTTVTVFFPPERTIRGS